MEKCDWENFAQNHDITQSIDADRLEGFSLNEICWIKDVLYKRIAAQINDALGFIKEGEEGFTGAPSDDNNANGLCYRGMLVYSYYRNLAVPGEWVEKAFKIANRRRREQEEEAEAERQRERERLIHLLAGQEYQEPEPKAIKWLVVAADACGELTDSPRVVDFDGFEKMQKDADEWTGGNCGYKVLAEIFEDYSVRVTD